ncbi:MAG TPA: HAD-IA family hydrolase [Nitrospirota bacterium]|nr:HAD-IA family hydrolase [Nitrospirota bacterium]
MLSVSLFIFDLDGTLVNTLEDITASLNYTLTALGRPQLPPDTVRQYVGDGLTMLLSRALGGSQELLGEARGIYAAHHGRNLLARSQLYPGVRETLEHFKAVPMAVISNKATEFVEPLLRGLGIAHYFRSVVGADRGLPLKPAPDAVLTIMAAFGAPRERTVMVGDGTTDVKAGKAAGVITCAVTYGFRSEAELRQAGPDHILHDFAGLMDLFRPATG